MDRVPIYKIKLTEKDKKDMEKTLLDTSKVYRWLVEAGIGKNELRVALKVRYNRHYELFRYPMEFMTLEKLAVITELLPDKSMRDVLIGIAPEYTKSWYEIKDWEMQELDKKLKEKE
tara:strand:- start:5005 stop:5355 length:351 start_codon:yes stop_codon:yes gene_type:complete